MGYSSGILNRRVTFIRRVTPERGAFGHNSGSGRYERVGTVWAAVDFSRGLKAMREGALDAYDTVMVRLRWNGSVSRDCLLQVDGKTWQIESFNESFSGNQIQITAREQVGGPSEVSLVEGLMDSSRIALECSDLGPLFVELD